MTTRIGVCLLSLAPGLLAAAATDLQLTGLIDIPGCRIACLREAASDTKTSLRPGQSAFGLKLETIDAKAGKALFLNGTNQVWLTLVSAPAPAPVSLMPATAPADLRAQYSRPTPNQIQANAPLALPGTVPEQSDSTAGFGLTQLPIAGALFVNNKPGAERTDPSLVPQPRDSTGGKPEPTPAGSLPSPSSTPSPQFQPQPGASPDLNAGPGTVATSQNPASAETVAQAPSNPAPGPNPNRPLTEAEQIRLFYGTQAFLSWDLGRHQ